MPRRQFQIVMVSWLVTTIIAVVALCRTFVIVPSELVVKSIVIEHPSGGFLANAIPGRVVIDPSGITMENSGRVLIGDNLKLTSNQTSGLISLGGSNGSVNLAPTHLKRLDTGWSMPFEAARARNADR